RTGSRDERRAHQVIAGAVDEIAVAVELIIAAPGIIIDGAELLRTALGRTIRLRHDEPAFAVDRHVGGDGFVVDGALHRIAGNRPGIDAARGLLALRGLRD